MPRSTDVEPASGAVVYLAGVEWDAVRGTDRHLAEHLADTDPVLWVDPVLSVTGVLRRRDGRRLLRPVQVSDVGPGVRRVSVLAPPFPERRGMRAITRLWTGVALRHALRRLRVHPSAVVGASPYLGFGVVPRPGPGTRLYLATDDFVAGSGLLGHRADTLAAAEGRRLLEADVVAAVSPLVLQRWGDLGRPAVVLPNGCDAAAGMRVDDAPTPDDVELVGPVAGVVGQLSPRLDLALLEAVADAGISLLLVGPLLPGFAPGRFEALVERPNVRWVGRKPFEALPSYLRLIDVGLTPYTDSDFNRASFPLKTLEYLAAGRPVVSTPLPAVTALATDLVQVAGSPADFVRAVRRAASSPRTASDVAARRRFAAGHDWARRAADLRRALGLGERPEDRGEDRPEVLRAASR